MELSSTIIDLGVGAVVLISAFFAYSRGLLREVSSLAVWVLAALAAFQFFPAIEPVLVDLSASAGVSLGSWTSLAALMITFVLALIVLSVLFSALRRLFSSSLLGGIDKGLGFLFGALRGLFLLALGWMIAEYFQPGIFDIPSFQTSRGAGLVREASLAILNAIPPDLPGYFGSLFDNLFGERSVPGYEAPAQPNEGIIRAPGASDQ